MGGVRTRLAATPIVAGLGGKIAVEFGQLVSVLPPGCRPAMHDTHKRRQPGEEGVAFGGVSADTQQPYCSWKAEAMRR